MKVRCARCGQEFDDTYRWTFCPHDDFDMRTLVVRPGFPDVVVTTLEELNEITSTALPI